MEKLPKIAFPIIIALVVGIILISKSAVTIGSGEGGVLYKQFSGGVDTENTYGEGFHIVAPWNSMIKYEVRDQSVQEQLPALLSVDGLPIEVDLTIQFKPMYNKLGNLHQTVGVDYYSRKVKPAINSVARRIIGQYTAEELYSSKKNSIQNEIQTITQKDLADVYIDLIQVLVEKIELPSKITAAIEDKKTKEQDLEKYKYLLQTAQKEAEKVIIEAQGKADANRILSASLTDKILQDKGIEATVKLSESPNSKVIVIGSGDSGMPIILGNQ
ncbi:prohibitin family protein [Olleya namhaensis]|uniref:Regulator of protease activity HflC, stomatin/prohibitin superfamily n=1 Tax=Olleya namhaensis TaxID=1144750 RepID=A0A1I3RDB6_9FLAO|nr:prohibitin family protein [Olleya namhaensis]SFJ43307.1 Regulator of protease activity HflC, stomatin/prohibitin superfamily [Olleya namhaensis]